MSVTLHPLSALADRWRDEAEILRRRGASRQAEALESAADELEASLREWLNEPLTVAEGAEASGYSTSHLRRLIREGQIPNAGKPGAPRIRRMDVPRKPGHRTEPADGDDDDVGSRMQMARSVVESD